MRQIDADGEANCAGVGAALPGETFDSCRGRCAIGKIALNRSETLRKYSIPEPVIGGFLAGIVVAAIYFALNLEVTFLLEVQPFLLLYFFGD